MTGPETPRRGRWLLRSLWLLAALAALGLPLAGLFIVSGLDEGGQPFRVEGDGGAPAAASELVRLLGVVPDESDDLLDPEGRPVGRMLDPHDSHRGHWGDAWLRRTLVFELAETQELLIPTEFLVSIPGTEDRPNREGIDQWDVFLGPSGRRMFVLDFFEAATQHRRSWFGRSVFEYDRLTVTVRYCYGVPDEPLAAFEAPFEVDRAETRRAGETVVTLTSHSEQRWPGGASARFRLVVAGPVETMPLVMAVDTAGRAHPSGSWQGGWGGGGGDIRFDFPDLPLARIAKVVVGGRPRETTFRNIRVRYPDRPARTCAPYLDRMAEVLGLENLTPKELERYQFNDVEEAIQVLGIVRGNHLYSASRLIIRAGREGKLESLDPKQREALRADAASLLEAVNPKRRFQAVELGLAVGPWPEFVDPAIDLLDEPGRGQRHEAAMLLERYVVSPRPEQLGRIVEALRKAPDIFLFGPLRRCLAKQKTPEATAVLKELAADDRPWVWMVALDELQERKALGRPEEWSDERKWRVALLLGPARVGEDPGVLAAARRRLPELLTPHLLRMYRHG